MENLSNLRQLTDLERLDARDAAKEVVNRAAGEKPLRADFDQHTASEYPPYVTRLITALAIIVLIAAFLPSAMRLNHIGHETFSTSINHPVAASVAGAMTVLLAEIGQVVFSLALVVMGGTKSSRRLLYGSMALATAIAIVGNVQLAMPGHYENPFAWLEALSPPLLVLSIAYVLKEQMLTAVRTRHGNEQAYQQALGDWQQATARPEQSPYWLQSYANALKNAIWSVNARGRGKSDRIAFMEALSTDEWIYLVQREMNADEWFDAAPELPGHMDEDTAPVEVQEVYQEKSPLAMTESSI